ncbi:unnamed protein product [Arctia plantaginis]|uniref:Uncharacterized protein n=1 Tax=Arctia plantaginis TaxID=874455 RepID=A0A8S0Z3G1_ARCPL|nr:unnamed protein product [Arctia plantaginis]
MNKAALKSNSDPVKTCCSSSFTLTFVVELLGIDVFHDCNEGWLDLGPGPVQGMKLQYVLAPGFLYEAEIMIWPHVAKVWCGINSGWVRTWHFLQRRWLAFSIRHVLPVRVTDYRYFTATVSANMGLGNLGTNAKTDKSTEVYLPKLSFGERRQFATVCEHELEESISKFIYNLIWSCIVAFIPASNNDGPMDIPHPVTDKRHQDAVLEHVQKTILNQALPKEIEKEEDVVEKAPALYRKSEIKSKETKDKDKKNVAVAPVKFEITLSGDAIISGTGRIVPFKNSGDRPPDLGEIIVLIGTASLPARDDFPVVFVNCGRLTDIPVEELKKRKITQLYTKWTISDDVHCSKPQNIKNEIDFDDQHAVPLKFEVAGDILSSFLDNAFKIEIRGIRQVPSVTETSLFGYAKNDHDFYRSVPPKLPNQDNDILIAITKIDARCLSKSINTFKRGEFPIYPPEIVLMPTEREKICTNDINAVRVPIKPDIIVPAYVILKAQMTLESSIGLVGCKPHKALTKYSRLYCVLDDSEAVMTILRHITEINEQMVETGSRNDLITGFALDTGDKVMLYVEGPRDGQILRVWDITEEFYPNVKPVFSTSAKYCSRLYPELLKAAMPFNVLKMFVPLSVVLACPPIYARPALPLPTRFAVLKIGRLIAGKLLTSPCSSEMPTSDELKSFRLELCVAPRPPPVSVPVSTPVKIASFISDPSGTAAVQKINWEKND